MLEDIGEVPAIDQAFFYAFCHKSETSEKVRLDSPEDRKRFLEQNKEGKQ